MVKNPRVLFVVPAVVMFIFVFFTPAPARAQSVTIINSTACVQYISVGHSSGQMVSNITPNGQRIKETSGSGITRIKAGPTASVEDCCYRKKVDIQPNLSGNTWRIEIHPDRLRVIDGDHGWTEAVNYPAALDSCNFSGKTQSQGLLQKDQ